MTSYEDFRDIIHEALRARSPLTWTEIRTSAKLPQLFPNNQWVRRLEKDIGLERQKDVHGIIQWTLNIHASNKPTESPEREREATGAKPRDVE